MVKKLTNEEFIQRAKEIHGDKYDYSNTEYEHSHKKVEIKCNNCKEIFPIVASNHINIRPSKGKASGCYNCFKQNHSVLLANTTKEFIEKAKEIHGDKFDYSNTNYEHSRNKVEIICKFHAAFKQRPSDHLSGAGCKKCATDLLINNRRKLNEDFIRQANEYHNYKFDYNNTIYKGANKEIEIICPNHGPFKQIARHHLDCKWGCPGCSHIGISKISLEWLEIMKIVYNCNIVNGLNSSEFRIDDIGKVDGFCYEKSLVFEFHGDFWHGNPKIFNKNEFNKVSKKKFSELYNKTIERDLKILEKGYNLIYIWEYDWNLKKKLNNEIINRCFKCLMV